MRSSMYARGEHAVLNCHSNLFNDLNPGTGRRVLWSKPRVKGRKEVHNCEAALH